MSLIAKIWWTAGLLTMLIIVIAISQANVINCRKVQRSIHGMYEDRLVVKGIILELLSAVHQKELAVVSGDLATRQGSNLGASEEIHLLLDRFRGTKLTSQERVTLDQLQSRFEDLATAETRQSRSDSSESRVLEQLGSIKSHLHTLSKIQQDEGNRTLQISVKASEYIALTARVGKYLAGAIILVMVLVVLAQPRKRQAHGAPPE